jgi:hypothetical protein
MCVYIYDDDLKTNLAHFIENSDFFKVLLLKKYVRIMTIVFNLISVKTMIWGLILCERTAGRLARNVVLTGKVLLNGKKRRLDYGVVVSYFLLLIRFLTPSPAN